MSLITSINAQPVVKWSQRGQPSEEKSMPIKNGICIPMICIEVTFNSAKASMKTLHNKAPAAMPPAIKALVDGTAADLYNDFLKTLKKPVTMDCDKTCCDC